MSPASPATGLSQATYSTERVCATDRVQAKDNAPCLPFISFTTLI